MPRRAAGIFLLVGLAGCMVGPDYREPQQPVPNHWQAGKDPAAGLKPIDPESLKTWWRSFGDTRMDKLMDQALGGNLDLKIALTRIDQARAQRRGTRSALFPQVYGSANAGRFDNPLPGIVPTSTRFNLFELGFDAFWEIDLFGRIRRRVEAATADIDASAEDYAQTLVTLTADLARAYVEYRNLQSQLRITRSNLDTQRHTLRLTDRLFEVGVGTRHDVVRARAQAETTAAQIPTLEAELIATLRQLDVLVGRQPGALTAALAELGPVPAAPGRAILDSPAATIRHRPDLRVAERRLAAATALQGAAIAEWFPRLSLATFLGFRNTNLEDLFKSSAFSYGVAGNFLQPLVNFGRIQAGIDLADAQQKEAYFAFEKAVLEALRETETALTRYLREEVRRQTLARAVVDQRESVRLSQLRYQEGAITFLDVLEAQRALLVTELELARSQAAVSTDLIAVYKALGGGANTQPHKVVNIQGKS